MLISRRFIAALQTRLAAGDRQYQIARRAGLHPTVLSQILHDALPLRVNDPRVLRVGRELGLEPAECFDKVEGNAA